MPKSIKLAGYYNPAELSDCTSSIMELMQHAVFIPLKGEVYNTGLIWNKTNKSLKRGEP